MSDSHPKDFTSRLAAHTTSADTLTRSFEAAAETGDPDGMRTAAATAIARVDQLERQLAVAMSSGRPATGRSKGAREHRRVIRELRRQSSFAVPLGAAVKVGDRFRK